MKPHVADYQTRVICLRIVPVLGDTVRLTHYQTDLAMSNGEVYDSFQGYDFSGYEAVSSMAPGAVDLQGILGVAGISREAIASGVYDNARCYLFATSWTAPVEDEEPLTASTFGKATLVDDRFVIEEMVLIDALNQSVGSSYNAGCQKTFGNSTGPLITRCNVNLAAITVTGTLTGVTDRLICRDSARAEAANYFAYGLLSFTTGANAGLKAIQVKRHEADGTLELFEAMPYAMAIGDAYSLIPGCRKRLEDCRDKWSNVINFGGFPRIPTNNQAGQWGSN